MTDKAYIVANEQQEREVLEKLELEGITWITGRKPTEQMPSSSSFSEFPYVLFIRNRLSWGFIGSLSDEEVAFDGRKEEQMSEKYVVSQEFMDKLEEWRDNEDLNATSGKSYNYINDNDLGKLPDVAEVWWFGDKHPIERNNRLIAIIRWVNGEDVFEVDKPKKWVVRSKETDIDGDYRYVQRDNSFKIEFMDITPSLTLATRFDTKEEAESWANSHQEVVEVVDV